VLVGQVSIGNLPVNAYTKLVYQPNTYLTEAECLALAGVEIA